MHKNGDRGTMPAGLAKYQATHGYTWGDFAKSPDYGPVLRRLHGAFCGLCAYCDVVVADIKKQRRGEALELEGVCKWLIELGGIQGDAEEWRIAQVETLKSSFDDQDLILKWLRGEIGEHFKLRIPIKSVAEQWRLNTIRSLEEDPGPIDHFRPRNPQGGKQQYYFGENLTFEWSNLMYACPKCQDIKANAWPGTLADNGDDKANECLRLKAEESGYTFISPSTAEGYINPDAASSDARLEPFDFDECGKVVSRVGLTDTHRSRADRTIYDLKLNAGPLVLRRHAHFVQIFLHIRGRSRSRRDKFLEDYANPTDHKSAKWSPPLEFPTLIEAAAGKKWFDGRQAMPPAFRELYEKIESPK